MLFLTAGFAHVKHPTAPDALAETLPSAEQVISGTNASEANPDQSLDEASALVEDESVFADSASSEAQQSDAVGNSGTESIQTPFNDSATDAGTQVATLDAQIPETASLAPEQEAMPPVSTIPEPVEPIIEEPTTGQLVVRSNVNGDRVRINGKDYGSTALNLELTPGEYVIEVTKPGYKGWSKTVNLSRGGQQTVAAALEQITNVEFRDGAWRFGIVTGDGTYQTADGTRYSGGFLNKQFHGKGKLTLPDGTSYEGDWSNGKKDGYGTLTLANGDTYVGNFRDDEFNGEGTLTKANGDIYAGNWVGGKLNGEGSLTTKQGLMYVGGFIDNEFNGNGDITYPDGTHYDGGFAKSLFHGKGVLTYRDGKKYTGQFIDGQFHGKGELQNPNGSKITGTYKFGKPYGQATLTTPEGEVFTARSSEPGVCYRLKSYRATQCPPMEGW